MNSELVTIVSYYYVFMMHFNIEEFHHRHNC